MNKRRCTDIRPCNLMTCYACRRLLIDTTAEAMLKAGVSPEQVDSYRYPAINALAFEIPTPAPTAKPKARKAVEPMFADEIATALEALRRCETREGGRRVLAWFKLHELRQLAKAVELGACSRYSKDDLVEHLINFTVQIRLDHAAILNHR